MAKQPLDQWIREVLIDDTKDGACTQLALIHVVAGGRDAEIHVIKLGSKPWDPKELAVIFRTKAENHCSEIMGMQTFNLLAFYGGRSEVGARRPFTVQGESVESTQLMTEGPTPQGMVAQSMRHNEALMQLSLRHSASLIEASARMTDRLVAQNEKLSNELMEATNIVRDLAFQRDDVKDARKMEQLQYQRTTEERKKWLSFGPALINSVLNREVFPQSTADSSLIDSIVDSLTEEDIMKLGSSGIIKPEIWGPLAQRMAASLKKRRELAEAHAEIAEVSSVENELQ